MRHARRVARLGLDPSEVPAFKPSATMAVASLAGSLVTFWGVGTFLCWVVLSLAGQGPVAPGEALPGSRFDAYVFAHMAPPISNHVARVMIRKLDAGAEHARYEPGSALEDRLSHAAALDPFPDDAVRRWARHHFRTRAGKVALAQPSPIACSTGFDAFADALREGAVLQLAQACRNVPGDTGSRAAFKVGDFRNAAGAETEAILSRLPFPPPTEPSCLAGGDATPPAEQPVCRLLHAEVKKETRGEILKSLELQPPFARRWAAAMRVSRGAPMREEDRFAIDAVRLVLTPLAATIDEPIAIYLELPAERLEKLSPVDVAAVETSIAAHRSAFGDHLAAEQRCKRALGIAMDLSETDAQAVIRLCGATRLRAGEIDRARELMEQLPPDDPLHQTADDVDFGDAPAPFAGLDGPALARTLSADGAGTTIRTGALRSILRGRAGDPALLEWLREGFPGCERCDYHDQLEMLLLRRDAAELLDDASVLDDLEPILGRYRGVIENRPLGVVLRAGRAN
jgi:hypothetical protein